MRNFLRVSAAMLALGVSHGALAQAAPSDFTTAFRYDAAQRVVGVIRPDPDGAGSLHYLASRNTYDGNGRLTKVEEGELASWQSEAVAPTAWTGFTVSRTTDIAYDAGWRKIRESVSSGGTTYALKQYSYDAAGRLECTAVRMNPAIYGSLPASACTQGTAGSYGPDRITRNVYDAANQLLQVRRGVGSGDEVAEVTYSYTANGKQEYLIDANGNRAKFEYDGFDRLLKWIFPSGTGPTAYDASTQANALASAGSLNAADYEQYGYDAAGNVTSRRKRDGLSFSFQFDALNRLAVKTVPERSGLAATLTRDVFYGYDLAGRQTFARFDSTSGEGLTNAWDGFGRLTSTTQAIDGVSRVLSYQYDADGNRTRLTFPDSNYVNYSYDGLDRPLLIQRNGTATLASYSYDPSGQRSGFSNGSGGAITTSYGYDGAGRLTSLTNTPVASSYNNQYTLGYSPASQIASIARTNDAFAFTGTYNVNRNYTANGLNQYATAGAATFGYDANGNLTSDGTNSYTYDVENRLVAVSGGATASLRYDPAGRLYEITGSAGTTRFLNDGDALVAEYNTSGALLRRYAHGADAGTDDPIAWYEGSTFASASERMLRPDWQGSIVLTTDSSGGTVIAANAYDEYGIPRSGNQGRFQYTGQAWLAEVGMYYYKARIYSPTLGRFLQTDPIGYGDQTNLYAYVGNDPVNGSDFSGLITAIHVVKSGACGASLDGACPDDKTANQDDDGNNGITVIGKLPPQLPANVGSVAVFSGAIGWLKRFLVPGRSGNPHRYEVNKDSKCSADDVFNNFKKPGGSAPGAPAAKEGFTPRVPLAGGNNISQYVNSSTRNIVNTTLPRHIFYPGAVSISVTPNAGGGSHIQIVGTGNGNYATFNDALGELIFGQAAEAAGSGCGGATSYTPVHGG